MINLLYLLAAAVIAVGDQLFKKWIITNIELFGEMELLPGIVHLTHVHNTGAAFSIMSDMRWILAAISLIAAIVIIIYIFKSKIGPLGKVAAAAVLGGDVGNLIDRALLGYVEDMFELEFMNYAIFNVADCFIVVGGIVFVICYMVWTIRLEREEKMRGPIPELERLRKTKPVTDASIITAAQGDAENAPVCDTAENADGSGLSSDTNADTENCNDCNDNC